MARVRSCARLVVYFAGRRSAPTMHWYNINMPTPGFLGMISAIWKGLHFKTTQFKGILLLGLGWDYIFTLSFLCKLKREVQTSGCGEGFLLAKASRSAHFRQATREVVQKSVVMVQAGLRGDLLGTPKMGWWLS